MLYSPLDHDDEDDFSHLPTVDGEPLGDLVDRNSSEELDPAQTSEEAASEGAGWDEEDPPEHATAGDQGLFESEEIENGVTAEDDGGEGFGEAAALASHGATDVGALVLMAPETEVEQPADNAGSLLEAKKRALIWAAGAHLLLLVLLAILQTAPVVKPASEIVAISEIVNQQEPAWKKVAPPAPSTSAPPSMRPITAIGTSEVVMPEVDFNPTASELNVGSSFGSFGAGGNGTAGGNVSFMGNQGKGSHVVFVVDVSGSMSAVAEVGGKVISRFELLKRELTRSLSQLRGKVQYQVLYFSHFAWPHNEVDSNDSAALAKYEWEIKPGDRDVRIPRFSYLPVNPTNIARSRKIIEESNNPGGTNWGSGLLMALQASPKPDLVFFMTDGNRSDALSWVDEVTAANARGKRAIIHTTAMMEPSAAQELNDLARRNGGKFTVVNADGSITKSADFFKSPSN